MRLLLAAAFVLVTSVAAFTYRDLILGRQGAARHPEPPPTTRPIVRAAPAVAGAAPSVAELLRVDSLAGAYILAVQTDPLDVAAMVDLAFLYMKHGWFDRAVGPLARAREVDPSSELISRSLELALARAGAAVDLHVAAREFEELVAMWGEGC